MKNTELVKVKNILKHKGILNEVKELAEDKYTIKEAAKYFACATSQVKGYLTNYKDVFGDNIQKEIPVGKAKEVLTINKDGMFLLAILLGKKSKVAEEVFNKVNELVEKDSDVQQITMDEVASAVEKEKKIKTDNVIDFNDLKERKANKEEMVEVPELELTPEGIKVVMKKITKKELERRHAESKEKINELFESILEDIREYEEDEEDVCNCPDCLEEEINEHIHQVNLEKIHLKHTLDAQLLITSRYKEICELLDIDDLTSSIMIQQFVLNNDYNIDEMILDHLVKRKEEENEKKVGSLYHSIELLAIEKFDENKEDAYLHLVNELKYIIGRDLSAYINERCYDRLLKKLVKLNAYEDAQKVIFTLLSE